MDTETVLRGALAEGRVLTIIFHGGNKPGAAREILPLAIDYRYGASVHCWCLETRSDKAFRISAISFPVAGERFWYYCDVQSIAWLDDWGLAENPPDMLWPEIVEDDPARDTCPFALLARIWLQRHAEIIEGLGFEIATKPTGIELWSHFKNGKRRRFPDIYVGYFPTTTVKIYDGGGGHQSVDRPVARAWLVAGIPYRSMTRAFECFAFAVEKMLAGIEP